MRRMNNAARLALVAAVVVGVAASLALAVGVAWQLRPAPDAIVPAADEGPPVVFDAAMPAPREPEQADPAPGRELTISDLAEVLSASVSRLSHALRRLESLGWIRKEADADDDGEVATSVKDAFYRNLCSSSALGQTIVFENVAPPADVQAACNHVHFSKGSAGRYGFLPVPAAL